VAEQFPDWDELPDRAVLNGEVVARSMTRSGGSSSPVDAAVLASSISVWWLPFSNGAALALRSKTTPVSAVYSHAVSPPLTSVTCRG
jgi:hypothetical protein